MCVDKDSRIHGHGHWRNWNCGHKIDGTGRGGHRVAFFKNTDTDIIVLKNREHRLGHWQVAATLISRNLITRSFWPELGVLKRGFYGPKNWLRWRLKTPEKIDNTGGDIFIFGHSIFLITDLQHYFRCLPYIGWHGGHVYYKNCYNC